MNLNPVGNLPLPPGTIFGRISDLTPGRPTPPREREMWERLEKENEAIQNYPPPPKKVYAEIVLNGIVLAEVWGEQYRIKYRPRLWLRPSGPPAGRARLGSSPCGVHREDGGGRDQIPSEAGGSERNALYSLD